MTQEDKIRVPQLLSEVRDVKLVSPDILLYADLDSERKQDRWGAGNRKAGVHVRASKAGCRASPMKLLPASFPEW